jgi:hypothetical protein
LHKITTNFNFSPVPVGGAGLGGFGGAYAGGLGAAYAGGLGGAYAGGLGSAYAAGIGSSYSSGPSVSLLKTVHYSSPLSSLKSKLGW